MTLKLWLLALLVGIVAVIWLSQRRRRGTYRPLTPGEEPKAPYRKPELGTEAIDHASFAAAMARNDALTRRADRIQRRMLRRARQTD
ncbi:hypothetical protein D2N39_13540 [Gemmobacter lutimaris]|uniref:Uncharacterized protein n=1 Tax=Gemmobacter lutimaris TaxID=2306023 RepID=A0A398BQT0_9RHOB|nr:hypothetical protein [Gemmobacter lutimaris]RID91271.1 hypothetical protein D2N39_13540 [Gemmobacter lutimaris]